MQGESIQSMMKKIIPIKMITGVGCIAKSFILGLIKTIAV
jgi:hypothetical protein